MPEPSPTCPAITIRVENFRVLDVFEWTPSGVCALVGPNGSGKSTALLVLELLRRTLDGGMIDAIGALLGSGPLRNLDKPDVPARVTLAAPGASWTVVVDRTTLPDERATIGAFSTFHTEPAPGGRYVSVGDGPESEGQIYYDADAHLVLRQVRALLPGSSVSRRLGPILDVVTRSRYFARPCIDHLRVNGSGQSSDVAVDHDARNLFTVLRNWRDLSEHEHRYEFVSERMAALFPRMFKRFDFEAAAQRVSVSVVTPKWKEKLRPIDWSDGFFSCLVHLTSLASCDPGAIVGIDEPENSLHPALIRELVGAMRDWSTEQSVTIVCATHSPAFLDQFAEEPEQVYVMEQDEQERRTQPIALDQLKKKEWLRHYALGDLYSHSEVGAPLA